MMSPERGAVQELGLKVLGVPRQQVPTAELGGWSPWQKGPTSAGTGELLEGLQLGTRSSGGSLRCRAGKVRKAPFRQSYCS